MPHIPQRRVGNLVYRERNGNITSKAHRVGDVRSHGQGVVTRCGVWMQEGTISGGELRFFDQLDSAVVAHCGRCW